MKKLYLLDLETMNLPEVTSTKIFYKNKFHPDGLYSERIFGPIKDYVCSCGIYNTYDSICSKCGVRYTHSEARANTLACIKLPITIFNPLFLGFKLGYHYNITLNDFIYFKKFLIEKEDGEIQILPIKEFQKKEANVFIGAEAVARLIEWVLRKIEADPKFNHNPFIKKKYIDIYKKYKKHMFINKIIVLPPDLRPILFIKNNPKMYVEEKIGRIYSTILNKVNILNKTKFLNIDQMTLKNYAEIQLLVDNLYEEILLVFGSKTGLIRGNILGKRCDYSGRAVIVVDPSLKYNECKIPYLMLLEVYKYEIARYLAKKEGKLIFDILNDIENCLKIQSYKYFNVVEEVVNNKYVILNRQPTLHKYGMLGWKIRISSDETIKIHPCICDAYNADFDGDTMAAYFSITQEAEEDLKKRVFIENNLFNEANDQLIFKPSHDIVYGIYILSKLNPEKLPKPLYQYMKDNNLNCIDKKSLSDFLTEYIRKTKKAEILDEIMILGFVVSTRYNKIDLSIEKFIDSIIDIKEREKIFQEYTEEKNINKYIEKENELLEKLKKKCIFSHLIESGSRGSWIQAKQLFLQRGFVTNSIGNIIETPIIHNLAEGLTPQEMFLSSFGVRKGLADIADNTAVSGAFNRGLIYLGLEAKQGSQKEPCKTTRYLEMQVDEKTIKDLIGRYIIDENSNLIRITRENYKNFIDKSIKLRSPIFCVDKNFCHFCCPHKELEDLEENKTYNVGICAAQFLSEPATQMVLRVFHTSGATTKATEDGLEKDIVYNLRGVIQLFSKPDFNLDNISAYVRKTYNSYREYKQIKMLYVEILISCLMWSEKDEDFIPWRLNQTAELRLIGYNKVPGLYGFLLGCAFKNFKRNLINSFINNQSIGETIFEKLILNEF